MKNMFMAAAAIVGIIVVQMILAELFTWQIGEVFSRVSLGILFYYSICRMIGPKRSEKSRAE